MAKQLEKEIEKQSPHFDFFKQKKNQNTKGNKLAETLTSICMLFVCLFFLSLFWGEAAHAQKYKPNDTKAKLIYSQMVDELKTSNHINIDKFKELKSIPSSVGDSFSVKIVLDAVYNNNIDPDIKRKTLDFYYGNWNSGIQAEKKALNDCKYDIGCYTISDAKIDGLNSMEENIKDSLSRIKYVDNIERQLKSLELSKKPSKL